MEIVVDTRTNYHDVPVVALVGPSSAGKSWLARRLIERGIVHGIPSIATRPPRPGETDTAYDHIFYGPNVFGSMQRRGCFAITATGLYGHNYALRHSDIRCHGEGAPVPGLVLIKPQLVGPFQRVFGPESIVLGIHSANGRDRAVELMQARGQSDADIAARLAAYDQEIRSAQEVIDPANYFVSDGHPSQILDPLATAIRSRCY